MLEWSNMDTQAFLDLTITECAVFNEKTPDVPTVKYFSVAGEQKRELTVSALRMCHDIVTKAEGPNDGLVSSQSARWGEEAIIWPADHAQQIGWFNEPSFDWRDGWGEILNRIDE